MAKSIRQTMMLGTISISFPEMRRNAKEQAAKIEHDAGAITGSVTAAKHLMAGVVKHKAIKDYATACRAWWATVSSPWGEGKGGYRGVVALAVPDLKVEIGDRVREYFRLVDEFMPEYPNIRAQRKFELGDLFDPKQFPSPSDLRRKFRFTCDFVPVGNNDDIRILEGLDQADVDKLVADAVKSEKDKLNRAMESAAKKLYQVVKSMHTTMATPIGEKGAKFNDTKLENIIRIAELIPSLNLTGDPKLAAMAKEAKKLAQKSPVELREDAVKRAGAAKEAETLANKLAGMFTMDTGDDEEE